MVHHNPSANPGEPLTNSGSDFFDHATWLMAGDCGT
jgi:hypothetical protein